MQLSPFSPVEIQGPQDRMSNRIGVSHKEIDWSFAVAVQLSVGQDQRCNGAEGGGRHSCDILDNFVLTVT